MSLELSVVVPVHNEIGNVGPLLSEVRAALDDRAEYEILCVDDGSDDGTGERFRRTLASSAPRSLPLQPERQAAGD